MTDPSIMIASIGFQPGLMIWCGGFGAIVVFATVLEMVGSAHPTRDWMEIVGWALPTFLPAE
jgi:hypothetical protein